jgi:S1-C subfamily serine protease
VLDGSGVIVTNLHVIRGQTRVSIRLSNGDVYDDVSVVDVDERKDLVLLKIKAIDLSATILGDSEQVKVGDRVVLIGSPKELGSR